MISNLPRPKSKEGVVMSPSWKIHPTASTLGGVKVVNRRTVWATGGFDAPGEPSSPGVVLRTVDGGRSWQDVTPPDGENRAFHDVEAFDHNQALVLTVGQADESRIIRTTDGGLNWDVVFVNYEAEAFYDGIAFFDRLHGIALSDPVGGRFRILTTSDGGGTWNVAPTDGMPPALPGEAARATGTSLVTLGPRRAWFGTQLVGSQSRVFRTKDRGVTWSAVIAPIPGHPQFGIASLTFWNPKHGLAVGGSCPRTNIPSVVAETADGGKTWAQVGSPSGFRTSIASVQTKKRRTAVAVGLSGSDFTTDRGHTWEPFDYRVLRGVNCLKASCWAVGKNGVTAELKRR
jgi:photosystem II stability/assembly factor-like uncharacterized protein